jgi:hypothetical protein
MTQADNVHSTHRVVCKLPSRGEENSQDLLYICPPTFPHEQVFQAIERLRKEARDEIDRLSRFLDEADNHMAIGR